MSSNRLRNQLIPAELSIAETNQKPSFAQRDIAGTVDGQELIIASSDSGRDFSVKKKKTRNGTGSIRETTPIARD
jgi:hypothetical protein